MIKIDNFPENENRQEPEDDLQDSQESEIPSETDNNPETDSSFISDDEMVNETESDDIPEISLSETESVDDDNADMDEHESEPEIAETESSADDDVNDITEPEEQEDQPEISDNELESDDELQDQAEPQEQVNVEDFQLENQKGIIEALIFAANDPITLNQLARTSNLTKASVEDIIKELNHDYQDTGRSFRIEHIAGGYRMYTMPEFHSYINQAGVIERTQKLSQAALESLAVIAYKQPITRAEIERIRGVDCGGVLKNLMTKDLIVIDGRSDAPGKPILYRTSAHFLEFFGLSSLDQLPPLSEIEDHSDLPKLTLIKNGENNGNGSDSDDDTDTEGDITNRLSGKILSIEIPEELPDLLSINLEDDTISN